jgi:uncharacterized membrane protein
LGVLVDNNEVAGGKTSMGMEENVGGLLCYLIGALTGIVFLAAEKNSMFVKFHAWQSILLTVAYIAGFIILMLFSLIIGFFGWLGFLLSLFGVLVSVIYPLAMLAITILCMFKAYKGETYKLPLIGDIAHKQAYGS